MFTGKKKLLVLLLAVSGFANAQVSFTLDSAYATSGHVSQPVLGDFNKDGLLDIAAISYDSSFVCVRLGTGAGKFGTSVKYTTGVNSQPTGIQVADFNKDGKLDIITSCDNNEVSMLLGNGSGGFGAPTLFAGGYFPRSITVADFNNDGNADVAIAYWIVNAATMNIGLWLGDGAGGLTSFNQFSIFGYSYLQGITAVDFNKDGNMDIAATINTGLNKFFIMLGNGSGGFSAATAYATGPYPLGIAVGDFNGDAISDLAIANTSSSTNISVHNGNGSGGFSAKTDFAVGNNPVLIVAADLNNDTLLDLVATSGNGGAAYVLPGKGGGTFGNYITVSTSANSYPVGVAVGDVNNDGKPDLVICATYNFTIDVFLNCTSVIISNSTNVSCNGGNNGTATTKLAFGTPPYTYTWSTSPVQTTATATGLTAGTYTVTVHDGNNVITSNTVTISQPTAVAATMSVTNTSACNVADGKITATPSGGTPGYSYSWNNGGSTATITGLLKGTYTLTLTDSKGCAKTFTAVVQGGTNLGATATYTNVTCYGGSDGKAKANPTNGNPPYAYSWSNGQTTQLITGLLPATYTATVTDFNTCTKSALAAVSQPAALLTTTLAVTNATSCSANNGKIKANVSGGYAGYKYLWNPTAQTVQTAVVLTVGSYTVTITDGMGCTKTDSAIVSCTNAIIESNFDRDLNIIPNPSNGIFIIQTGNHYVMPGKIEIRNILGEKIYESEVKNEKQGVDLTKEPDGIYFVQFKTENSITTKKIIINK